MQRTLFWNTIPSASEIRKDKDSTVRVLGADLYGYEALKALLQYSSYEKIALPREGLELAADAGSLHLLANDRGRVEWLRERDLHNLKDRLQVVIGSANPMLRNLVRLRQLSCRPRTPIMGAIHSIHDRAMLQRLLLHVLFAPVRPFDALLCQSRAGEKAIREYLELLGERLALQGMVPPKPELRLVAIPEGIFVSQFTTSLEDAQDRHRPLGDVKILYLGRLSSLTKADLFPQILAFSHVHRQYPNTRLVIAGDDRECQSAASIQSLAVDLGLGTSVEVYADPDSATKRRLYAEADIFVTPSDNIQETFGRTVVEAMAAGLPVVAADWDGYRDTVIHGETGFLIPTYMPAPSNSLDVLLESDPASGGSVLAATTTVDLQRLQDAIAQLVADPELRKRMGDAGRKRAMAQFDWSVIIGRYEELWEELNKEASASTVIDNRSLDLETYPFQRIFGHYATSSYPEADRVRSAVLNETESNTLIAHVLKGPFVTRKDIIDCILDTSRAANEQRWDELTTSVAQLTRESLGLVELHAARLRKYGLLVSAQPEDTQRLLGYEDALTVAP